MATMNIALFVAAYDDPSSETSISKESSPQNQEKKNPEEAESEKKDDSNEVS